ncbi:hypothetical protein FACS1894208_02400 [Clostridia bacterium]|nr:hypothetical protein FACS1894208_02400 [Clostridia bacterium]
MGRFGIGGFIVAACVGLLIVMFGTYLIAGAALHLDAPIVRNITKVQVLPPASYDALAVSETWDPTVDFVEAAYLSMFSSEETEDEFFARMSDIDRRSLYALTREFPELLSEGWSRLCFDVYATPVSLLLDDERGTELKERVLSGAVTTKRGDPIYAIDGVRSLLLIYTEINQTPGYSAISYDKTKVGLSISYGAFEGRWSTVREHIAYVDGVVGIPANDYTYNARMGYGVVDGGFTDAGVVRYKSSGDETLYLGLKRDGTFAVGEFARYGMYHFSEGQGTLLIRGAVPERVIVPEDEQRHLLERLANYITVNEVDAAGEVDGTAFIKDFLESFDDYMLQAQYAWIIRENTTEDAADAAALIELCDTLGAASYAEEAVPVRSAYTALGQRAFDGATLMVGIGGAKNADVKDAPGNGATIQDLQDLFIGYGMSNAAVTTSGNRVGFAWKDRSLLRVQDTTLEGGRTYGAYYLK